MYNRGGQPKLVFGSHWEKIPKNINYLSRILEKILFEIIQNIEKSLILDRRLATPDVHF
jgi:hypothetical protein